MARFSNLLRNIFYVLLILQFAPPLIHNIRKQYSTMLLPHTKVGVITLRTAITNAQPYLKQLRHFFKNNEIKAILLRIDSPGGTAGSSQAIFYELKELKSLYPKPVIAFVENVCASGSYYVACGADEIIATPSAFIGSIGVYIPQPQFKEFIEQFKIKYSVVNTGDYKMTGDPFLAHTPEQEALLQGLTKDTYDQFTYDVAQSRPKLSLTQVKTWADGKIFTGRQAVKLGLIDMVGSPITAEKVIKEKAGFTGEIEWIKPPQPSALAAFFGKEDGNDDSYIETAVSSLWNYAESKLFARAQ